MSDAAPVVNNEAASRFEIEVDGQLAELVYHRSGKRLVLVHTGVPDALEGRGIGGLLVTAAIDEAAAHAWTVVPLCPFARGWLERHPDVANRVTIDWKQNATPDSRVTRFIDKANADKGRASASRCVGDHDPKRDRGVRAGVVIFVRPA